MQTTNWANEGMEGQGHFFTLASVHLHMKVKTCFSKKLLGHFLPNLVCKLSGTREWKSIYIMLVTWPRCPQHPLLKNLLLPNWSIDFHETLYVASGTPVHQSLFKWWPCVDLDRVPTFRERSGKNKKNSSTGNFEFSQGNLKLSKSQGILGSEVVILILIITVPK